ncbi:MAG: tyrosine-type recombinase/integrase [Planctomycetaceae bacterium]|nr:tyrosine-type recombinase/integrase [Planctomycetaceae bacterium]
MEEDRQSLLILNRNELVTVDDVPQLIRDAGASFAWEEFFAGVIRNQHTRIAYQRAVRQFLAWLEPTGTPLNRISPGQVGAYFNQHPGSVPTRKVHLAALRAYFDLLTTRHQLFLNPATSVRLGRYSVVEGKTPEISREQARMLLQSIATSTPVGRRDKAILATLIYTAARAGAIAALRVRDFTSDGTQYSLRFLEKGGKSRSIPVRHDLQVVLLAALADIGCETLPKEAHLFRTARGRTGLLGDQPLNNIDICRMVKRRLRDAGLPELYSPHSFRVATVTDLLEQGIPLEDVQYLAGHADPRTTRLYDRRQKRVTRNTVERISI